LANENDPQATGAHRQVKKKKGKTYAPFQIVKQKKKNFNNYVSQTQIGIIQQKVMKRR
jgi:hypothetical protein